MLTCFVISFNRYATISGIGTNRISGLFPTDYASVGKVVSGFQFNGEFALSMSTYDDKKAKILNGITGTFTATGSSSIAVLQPINILLPPRGSLSFSGSLRRSLDGIFDMRAKAEISGVRLGNVRIETFTASMRLTALPPFGNGTFVAALREFWGGNDKGSSARYNNAHLGRISVGVFDGSQGFRSTKVETREMLADIVRRYDICLLFGIVDPTERAIPVFLDVVNAGQDAEHPYKVIRSESGAGEDTLAWFYKTTSVEPVRDEVHYSSARGRGRERRPAGTLPHAVHWKRPGYAELDDANVTLTTIGVPIDSSASASAQFTQAQAFTAQIEAESNPVYGTLTIVAGKASFCERVFGGGSFFSRLGRNQKLLNTNDDTTVSTDTDCGAEYFIANDAFQSLIRQRGNIGVFRHDTAYVDIYSEETIAEISAQYPIEMQFDFTKSKHRGAASQASQLQALANCFDYPAGWTDKEGDGCAEYQADNGWYCKKYGKYMAKPNQPYANKACCACGGGRLKPEEVNFKQMFKNIAIYDKCKLPREVKGKEKTLRECSAKCLSNAGCKGFNFMAGACELLGKCSEFAKNTTAANYFALDERDGRGLRNGLTSANVWGSLNVSTLVHVHALGNGPLLVSINASIRASNESLFVSGSITAFNPFNLTWLKVSDARASMELVSALSGGEKHKVKEPRDAKDADQVDLSELTVAGTAHIVAGNVSLSTTATFFCRENCRDKYIKIGFIRLQQGGLPQMLHTIFGIAPESVAFLNDIKPSFGTSMDLTISNFDGLGVRNGYLLRMRARIHGELHKELSESLPKSSENNKNGTWTTETTVMVSFYIPLNGTLKDMEIELNIESTMIELTENIHFLGFKLRLSDFAIASGLRVFMYSKVRVILPADVGALYLDVQGDLRVDWGGNVTTTKGQFVLGGRLDGTWTPEFLNTALFKLSNPSVRLFIAQECAEVNSTSVCTAWLEKIFLASKEISLSESGGGAKIGLLDNEFNITRFRPTSAVQSMSTLHLAEENNTEPLFLKMETEWEGKNREFKYSGKMLKPWNPMGSGFVRVHEGHLNLNLSVSQKSSRILAANIDGLVSAQFANIPINTTLRIVAAIKAPGLKDACIVLKDLPIPTIGELFDAMGLPTMADLVNLNGNLEAGYVDVGLSTTKKKLCGDATHGVGLTITLRLLLGEESALTGVFQLLDPDVKKVNVDAMLFLPHSLLTGGIPDPSTRSPTARDFDSDDWNKVDEGENLTCITCLSEPIVMRFKATARPVVDSKALATLSDLAIQITIHNLLERPGFEASANLYIKTSNSQRMKFSLLGKIPAGDWPLLEFYAKLINPADLNLMGEGHDSFHINTAQGHVIYQTGMPDDFKPDGTAKKCKTRSDCRDLLGRSTGLTCVNGICSIPKISWNASFAISATVVLDSSNPTGVAVSGSLDLLNSGTDWIFRAETQIEKFSGVLSTLFKQPPEKVEELSVGDYLPDSRLTTTGEIVVSTVTTDRRDLGFGRGAEYNHNVTKGFLARLSIKYKQENEMGKVLTSMIGDMEPGVNSLTSFELFVPIFDEHPERIQLRMIYRNNLFPKDAQLKLHEAELSVFFSVGVLAKEAPAVFTRIVVSIPTDVVPFPLLFRLSSKWSWDKAVVFEGELLGELPAPFDMPYISFGNVRVQFTVKADPGGMAWEDFRMYGDAFFFSPCDCSVDAPRLERHSDDPNHGDICRPVQTGRDSECPKCCSPVGDDDNLLSRVKPERAPYCVQNNNPAQPCRADGKTEAFRTVSTFLFF